MGREERMHLRGGVPGLEIQIPKVRLTVPLLIALDSELICATRGGPSAREKESKDAPKHCSSYPSDSLDVTESCRKQ
jgi:hypothetical protein